MIVKLHDLLNQNRGIGEEYNLSPAEAEALFIKIWEKLTEPSRGPLEQMVMDVEEAFILPD